MTLRRFIESADQSNRVVGLVNWESTDAMKNLVRKTFENHRVPVVEKSIEDLPSDSVVLFEDGEIVATSPLDTLQKTLLFVNTDIYTTGQRGLDDLEVPDIVTGLAGTTFRLRGFPKSDTQKLVLVTISRYIERIAFETGEGTLRTACQRLSRLETEPGTKRVYQRLAATDLAIHAYGVPDTVPSDIDIQVHPGWDHEFKQTWVVVYRPPSPAGRYAALVAYEQSPQVWDGYWTFKKADVRQINEYLKSELQTAYGHGER